MSSENFIQFQDGAVVAFEEYGDANGVPVIFCHGWPSSRTMARLTDEPARELGIRIISPDRPGISGSSLQPDRKLSDWPRVVERIGGQLGVREFRMLAISGGAPYAYATAIAMPERVQGIAIVGGAPQWRNSLMPKDCCRFTAGCWPFIEPTATLAQILSSGAAGSVVAAACALSSAVKNVNVATVRC
jgi:pimeloyl-ACP methyl ester carboxylesterase